MTVVSIDLSTLTWAIMAYAVYLGGVIVAVGLVRWYLNR